MRIREALLAAGILMAATPEAAAAQSKSPTPATPGCQFILGFKTLHDALTQIVGDCVDNQSFAPNGDALQHTTKGLLVWRKADNFTAFTDGYRSWINGPLGIQQRLNSEKLPWELPPLPAALMIPPNPFAENYRQKYSLSCEVAAVNMALAHYNMQTSEDTLLSILSRNPNPDLGFRGEPNSGTESFDQYGAHAPAIKSLIENYPRPGVFKGHLLNSTDEMRRTLAQNELVIAWIPAGLRSAQIKTISFGDDNVNLVSQEHAVLVHGYDQNGVYLYDPLNVPGLRLNGFASNEAFAKGTSYFQHPFLAIEPSF